VIFVWQVGKPPTAFVSDLSQNYAPKACAGKFKESNRWWRWIQDWFAFPPGKMPVEFNQRLSAMLSQRVVLSPDALFQEIGGEGVILDLKSSSYFGLDEVGVRLWQLLQADPNLQAACDTLLTEYEVEPARLEQDLIKLLEQLTDAGLATVE
jgi:hypothetical protein